MFKYRNEAAFSQALVKHLRAQGWFIQRIETGSTGRGVPDIYAITPLGEAIWIELKRVHKSVAGRHYISVPWRPGQQAWLLQVTKLKQQAITLVACDDMILGVHHYHCYKNDIVPLNECQKYLSISAL